MTPPPARPPSVLYFINGFERGGAELGLIRLVGGGAFAGCDLTVASIFAGDGQMIAKLKELGVEVRPFSGGARMTTLSLFRAVFGLVTTLLRHRPDVLILSLPQANLLGRLLAWTARPRVVASFEHNTRLAKPIYERGWRATSGAVDWLIADAPQTAAEVSARLYRRPPRQVIILPLVSFPDGPAPEAAPHTGPLRLVNAARFTGVKNQAALIRAVALLKGRGVAIHLTLYGEGPELPACRALVERLGLGDQVDMPGFRDDWWRERHDLFVLPSRHEGLCIVALEAMNAAIPVAAPLIGGLRDYASPDCIEVLGDVEPETIAGAVERLAADPARRIALGQAGRVSAQAHYGAAAVSRAYDGFAAALRDAAS
jgi:glycosyltransferase involved in cell wall biosynthesis